MTKTTATSSFKAFSGVTAKKFTAEMLAKKAVKATGREHVACEVPGGGWTVKEVFFFPATPKKTRGAKKDPNAWIVTAAAALRERLANIGLTKDAVKVVEGTRAKVTINGVTATWFTKKEWADQVVAAI